LRLALRACVRVGVLSRSAHCRERVTILHNLAKLERALIAVFGNLHLGEKVPPRGKNSFLVETAN
jgi:hypothetical protein